VAFRVLILFAALGLRIGSRVEGRGSIDPYGDTTFNHLQMRRFLKEWAVKAGFLRIMRKAYCRSAVSVPM
jgi:hypothetical protein